MINPERLIKDPYTRGAWLVRVDGIDQSFVDPADPTHLEFDYLRRLGDQIDVYAPAGERLRVIHVGGAGMSLARYVAHTRPSSPQIVLEPDATLTEEVRAVVPLPPRSGIKVRAVDGRTGIAAMPNDYADVVVLDAFASGSVPADLVTTQFFADTHRVLHAGGLLLANLSDARPFTWSARVVASLAATFKFVQVSAEAATFKGRRFGNLVVAASDQELENEELARKAASSPFPYRTIFGDALAGFIGGQSPFTDEDTRVSDAPTGKLTWYG